MGVRYQEVDVSRDVAAVAEMVRKSGQRGVPVITIDDHVVVGFDPQRIQALVGKASRTRPALGLSIADASRMAMKAGSVPVFGALVGRVAPGSPAERAGLMAGDIVTEANLRPINNASDLEKVLETITAGSRLALVATRGDKSLRFQVVL
jgi:S1-C subfamily serine protease